MLNTVLWVFFWVALVSAALAGYSAAPWLPTRKKELAQLIKALETREATRLIDLGCGDGRILFALAQRFPSTVCEGVEISLLPYLAAMARKWTHPVRYKNVKIHFKSLYAVNLGPYDAVITFLLDRAYEKLTQKFKTELTPGSRVYIQAWPLAGIEPETTIKTEGILPLYIYNTKSFGAAE